MISVDSRGFTGREPWEPETAVAKSLRVWASCVGTWLVRDK